MQKKSVLLSFIFLFTLISSVTQNQAISTTIFSINIIESSTIVPSWSNISLIYPDQYHNPIELLMELEQMNNTAPEIIDLFSIGKSFQGRDIYCVRITNEQNTNAKAGVLILSGIHAREQISVEASLRFLLRLVNNYGSHEEITGFINTQEIFLIPSLNPDGLHYVVGNDTLLGNEWIRKNLRPFDEDGDGSFDEDPEEDTNGDGIISGYEIYEWTNNNWVLTDEYLEGNDTDGDGLVNEDRIGGVDLNRNFAYRWNDSSLESGFGSDTSSDTYPGTAPFSEPETQVFRDFVDNKSFATAISLHSGINATLFPWASGYTWANPTLYNNMFNDLAQILPNRFFGQGVQTLYSVAGDWADWMYVEKDCLVPMTFEIYHNGSSDDLGQVEEENATHRRVRWDGMYGYFAPEESGYYFDSLWEDIQPAFDYWLDNTPRLKVQVKSIKGGTKTGDTVEVRLSIINLSPRINSIENLKVVYENFDSVLPSGWSIPGISPGTNVHDSFEFELKQPLTNGNKITILIGNNFTGYTPIVIQENVSTQTETTPLYVMAPLLAIPVLVLSKISSESRKK